jgi:hypothetical protein
MAGKSGYSAEDESYAIQSANDEYDKAVAKLVKERDAAIQEAHNAFDKAVKPHRDKRDRQYEQAHAQYYRHQLDNGDMSAEARGLLQQQLAGEVAWDSAIGNVNKLGVDDKGEGADGGR